MKLFSTRQIAGIDRYTIENEPIRDVDLMERAAKQVSGWLSGRYSQEKEMIFFVGPGNNGGDALAVARQMADLRYYCQVYLCDFGKELQGSPAINLRRLKKQGKVKTELLKHPDDFPVASDSAIFIDGLFGSGLTRPLEGFPAEIVRKMNVCSNTIVSIDIPSGLMGEDNNGNIPENIIRADFTLTFQFPKISFLLSDNALYTGEWEVLPIGLHPGGLAQTFSDFFLVERQDVREMIPHRSRFAHKGTYGHALLIAGSYGKMGAAVLASKACLRAGAGLLTTHIPHLGFQVLQTAVPEAMASIDEHDSIFTGIPDLSPYTAIGSGPGIGMKCNTRKALNELIIRVKVPFILDADALNILSENKDWLKKLPENSILTPHPGEFRRLAGESSNSWEQLKKQQEMAREYRLIVVLKGAYTSVALPDGRLYFNSTGNPGMATAGSGDSLTGIILGLLAQGMLPEHAAIAGVFLHGLAGDLATKENSEYALIAGDITEFLGKAFLELK